jgi:beta-mannosidase
MEIRDPRNYVDPLSFRKDKGAPASAHEPRSFDLPDDVYKPSMKTSEEHQHLGSRALREGWKMLCAATKPGADDGQWKDIAMPSQWAVADPELFSYGGNVWYMKTFTVSPEETGPDKHLELAFKGVDYNAEVFLNDEELGSHEGYFTPFSFDLTGKVKAGEENTLLVKISAPEDKGGSYFKNQIKGIFGQHDARPGGNSAPATLGSTGGIWNDVLLESTGMETIKNQYVDSRLSRDNKSADLTFNYLLENHSDADKEMTVKVRYAPTGEHDPEKFREIEKTISLPPGAHKVELHAHEENPELWWTYDHGEPSLYEMETTVSEGEKASDSLKGHFGIRSIEVDKKTGQLILNGKPLYQRGTNYIPTQWLSTYNEEMYEKDLQQMKDANLNAVRVHASALPQEFYDAADKEGVIVWADFPLIWGTTPSLSFMAKARTEYKKFIDLYRNHPSIWTWSAHNEPLPYNALQDHLMDRDAAKLDPTRHHKSDSGFLEHFYPGWYDPPYGKEYTDIHRWKPKLPSEFGAEAIPSSMKEIIPKDKQWPINEHEAEWSFHDFQLKNNYKYIGHPSAFKDIDDYIDTSQKYQYDYTKYVVEYFRRLKYKPDVGMYQFMFKEAWPAATWAVEDYKNDPKMAFHALRESMNPTLVSIDWKKTRFRPGTLVKAPLWLINDEYRDMKDTTLRWSITRAGDEQKKPLLKGEMAADVPPDSSQSLTNVEFRIPKNARPGEKWILSAEWLDSKGATLSSNAYMFGTEAPAQQKRRYEPVYPEYPRADGGKRG